MILRKPGLIALTLLAGAAVVMMPSAKADDGGSARSKAINIECVLPGSAVTAGPGTCTGDLIGNAQIVDVATGGTALGTTNQNQFCYLDSSTDTLTTKDGSTLVLTTAGMTCYNADTGVNIRHNAYQITGGTGRFAGAGGAGNFVVSPSSSSSFAVHISGNIQLQK